MDSRTLISRVPTMCQAQHHIELLDLSYMALHATLQELLDLFYR